MTMSNKAYDTLKWIAQYFLPASGTLYFALSTIWGLPYGEQIVGTITAVDAFLGLLLGLSSRQYNKTVCTDGVLQIDTSGHSKDVYRFAFDQDVESLKDKTTVTLSVDANAKLP